MKGSDMIIAGTLLIFAGFFLIFAGFLKQAYDYGKAGADKSGAEQKAEIKGGGVVLIGPFPVIFGTDKQSLSIVIILAILLIIISWLFIKSVGM